MSDKLFQKAKKTSDDLKRQQVKQAAAILVVCEGETEGDYIRHLRQLWNIEKKVHLIDKTQHICLDTFEEINKEPPKIGSVKYGSDPVSVVDYAVAVASNRKTPFKPYEHIYCLFDKDDPARFTKACHRTKAIRGGEVVKITSVPCFEYWLLLHFTKANAPLLSVNNTIVQLKKTALSDYSADNKRIDEQRFSLLCAGNNINNAIGWAEELFKESEALNTDDPTTKMFELMKKFKPETKVVKDLKSALPIN
jgi:hypothetical protein